MFCPFRTERHALCAMLWSALLQMQAGAAATAASAAGQCALAIGAVTSRIGGQQQCGAVTSQAAGQQQQGHPHAVACQEQHQVTVATDGNYSAASIDGNVAVPLVRPHDGRAPCSPRRHILGVSELPDVAGVAASQTRCERPPWPRSGVGGRHRAEATLEPHEHVSLAHGDGSSVVHQAGHRC